MKLTRYAQSCFLLELEGEKILIDPGHLQYEESLLNRDWVDIDHILVTHSHKDHCHEEAIDKIIRRDGAKLYTSTEVVQKYPGLSASTIKEGDVIDLGSVRIEVVRAVHGYLARFAEGDMVIDENIGFIIDDGHKRFYHTSDCINFPNNYKSDIIALACSGHGICFGPYDGADFARGVGASLVIPHHYDHPLHDLDFEELDREMKAASLDYKVLGLGETAEI